MLLARHQNAGLNHDIKTADRSFGNGAQFKYLGMAVRNQNLIQDFDFVRFERASCGSLCTKWRKMKQKV
jgi:hypothetical protein